MQKTCRKVTRLFLTHQTICISVGVLLILPGHLEPLCTVCPSTFTIVKKTNRKNSHKNWKKKTSSGHSWFICSCGIEKYLGHMLVGLWSINCACDDTQLVVRNSLWFFCKNWSVSFQSVHSSRASSSRDGSLSYNNIWSHCLINYPIKATICPLHLQKVTMLHCAQSAEVNTGGFSL